MSGPALHVTADDRSGAMETASLFADAGLRAWARSWDGDDVLDPVAQCVVTDLRSRHLAPASAAVRAQVVASTIGVVHAHKMDSTLRGNWAAELGALHMGRGVLVVPAYPSAGRTCEGGIVKVRGVPVGETEFAIDSRSGIASSKPGDILRAVGFGDVCEAVGEDGIRRWLRAGATGACIADARSDDEVLAAVRTVGIDDAVLVAGTALTVASLSGVLRPPALPMLPAGGVLVICGSRHAASRAQATAVEGLPGIAVLYPPDELQADPEVVALELAVRAHDFVDTHRPATIVLLGGDTADAFIGERTVRVLGSLAPGLAVGEVALEGRTVTVLTKPGGFGQDQLLMNVLARRGTR